MNTLSRAAVGAAILFTFLATGPAAQQPAQGPRLALPGKHRRLPAVAAAWATASPVSPGSTR